MSYTSRRAWRPFGGGPDAAPVNFRAPYKSGVPKKGQHAVLYELIKKILSVPRLIFGKGRRSISRVQVRLISGISYNSITRCSKWGAQLPQVRNRMLRNAA